MEKGIGMIPVMAGKCLVWVMVVFMSCNIAVSCMALIRYDERSRGITAEASWQQWCDIYYDDAKLMKIYPNAVEPK